MYFSFSKSVYSLHIPFVTESVLGRVLLYRRWCRVRYGLCRTHCDYDINRREAWPVTFTALPKWCHSRRRMLENPQRKVEYDGRANVARERMCCRLWFMMINDVGDENRRVCERSPILHECTPGYESKLSLKQKILYWISFRWLFWRHECEDQSNGWRSHAPLIPGDQHLSLSSLHLTIFRFPLLFITWF